jgi:hypothetical protein
MAVAATKRMLHLEAANLELFFEGSYSGIWETMTKCGRILAELIFHF